MANKSPTSLTSHSLFPSSGDDLDLDQLSAPFSFAPALVPTSAEPVVQPSSGYSTEEVALNPDPLEGEVEKFVGQPVTPPLTLDKSEAITPPRQHGTPPIPSNTAPIPSNTAPKLHAPTTLNPVQSIYSPMQMPPSGNVSTHESPLQPAVVSQNTPSKPVHAVPPFTQSQQSLFPPVMSSPYPPSAPPPTPEQKTKASPVRPHWFYLKHGKVWTPFSWKDSGLLHQSFTGPSRGGDRIVATDGGRYDVNIDKRARTSVYWNEPITVVRPCTWFCKAHDGENKLVPYEESTAANLEKAYLDAHDEQRWPKTVNLDKGETVIMHNSNVMVHFSATTSNEDEWTGEDIRSRPKVVRRGIDDFEADIDDGEPSQIDHLVFVVHGIGPYADLKFRSLIECVNDFRRVSLEMMDGRREKLIGNQDNLVGRIEFLPVLWYSAVHDDMSTGVDRRLQSITINSVTKLREFTNNTLLDILFFTSPVYCQTIVDKVGSEMNRLLSVFQQRNPSFSGSISVCGHSLGSAICFDILQHQGDQQEPVSITNDGSHTNIQKTANEGRKTEATSQNANPNTPPSLEQILQQLGLENFILTFQMEQIDGESLMMCSGDDLKELGIPMGPRKKILSFQKDYAKEKEAAKQNTGNTTASITSSENSVTASFTQSETTNVPLASHSSFRNLSQNPSSIEVVEILQYHHGQQGTAGTGQPYVRYPKLNFEPQNLFALGSPIGLFLTVRGVENIGIDYSFPTCPGFYNIFHPYDPVAYRIEPLVVEGFDGEPVLMQHHKGRKRMHLELRENLSRIGANLKQKFVESVKETWATINDFARAHTGVQTTDELDSSVVMKDTSDMESQSNVEEKHIVESIRMGRLNRGQRFDFVLQEKPIEILNEYLFALSSHVCYWQSEDTALFMLKEIYKN